MNVIINILKIFITFFIVHIIIYMTKTRDTSAIGTLSTKDGWSVNRIFSPKQLLDIEEKRKI